MQNNEVVKEGTDSGFQQGVLHMGRDVCLHVKSKCKHGSSLTDSRVDRFVHMNRFQPLFTCDIESNIESKCQNEDSTCASKLSKTSILPVVLSVKGGDQSVRGKKLNSSKHSNPCDKGESFGSAKSADSSTSSVSRLSKAVNTVESEQLTDIACSNPQGVQNLMITGYWAFLLFQKCLTLWRINK